MRDFFERIRIILADNITYSSSPLNQFPSRFSGSKSINLYLELQYRDNKVELDFSCQTFVLAIDLGVDLDLAILPKDSFDRFVLTLFNKSKRIRIKTSLLEDELVVQTNVEDIARNLLISPDISKIVYDYGINFFTIENGVLKVHLHCLSTDKFEALKSNPSQIKDYLNIIVDLSGYIKTAGINKLNKPKLSENWFVKQTPLIIKLAVYGVLIFIMCGAPLYGAWQAFFDNNCVHGIARGGDTGSEHECYNSAERIRYFIIYLSWLMFDVVWLLLIKKISKPIIFSFIALAIGFLVWLYFHMAG